MERFRLSLYPNLALVAKSVLSIPATSTSSERSFSIAGRTIDDRRTQLHPDCIDGLLFLHGLNQELAHFYLSYGQNLIL